MYFKLFEQNMPFNLKNGQMNFFLFSKLTTSNILRGLLYILDCQVVTYFKTTAKLLLTYRKLN